MDAVRGIAHQHQARVDVTVGVDEAQRIGPARSRRRDRPEMVAEPPRELRLEARCIEFEQASRDIGALGPHDRRTMLAARTVGHRQDGERAAGQEFFLGNAAMRLGMVGHQDDRDLVVRPAARADAGLLAHRAEAALGRGDEAGGEAPATLQYQRGATRPALGLNHLVGRDELDLRAGGEPAEQGSPQEAVLDDPAHRRGHVGVPGGFAMVEMKEERAGAAVVTGVGNPDVANRLGVGRHLVPDTERREKALAGEGDRGGAAIEARLGQGGEWYAVDERGRKPHLAGSQSEKAAVEPCPYDSEIERGEARGGEVGRADIRGTAIHGP